MNDVSTQQTTRLDWPDAARGGLILMVVIGHAWRGLFSAGLMNVDLFKAIDSRIYAFHMPAFFALSSLFLIASLQKTSASTFAQRRLVRLGWPLVFWTYAFLAIKALAGEFANSPAGFQEMLRLPFPGVLHLWFLWSLLLLSLACLALKPVATHGRIPPLLLIGIGAMLCVLYYVPLSDQIRHMFGQTIRMAPFFWLGVAAGQYWHRLQALPDSLRYGAVAVFAIGLAVWPQLASLGLSLPGAALLTCCILIVASSRRDLCSTLAGRSAVLLGTTTMAIYLTHTIFSAAFREALLAAGISSLTTHMVIGTLAGIVGPLMVLQLAKRTQTTRVFGF